MFDIHALFSRTSLNIMGLIAFILVTSVLLHLLFAKIFKVDADLFTVSILPFYSHRLLFLPLPLPRTTESTGKRDCNWPDRIRCRYIPGRAPGRGLKMDWLIKNVLNYEKDSFLFISITLLFPIATVQAAEKDSTAIVKKGWSFGLYQCRLQHRPGFQYGALAEFFHYGDGDLFPSTNT